MLIVNWVIAICLTSLVVNILMVDLSLPAGNVSVGNLNKFLPFVLQEIESQPKRQYLLLHSLKEVRQLLLCYIAGLYVSYIVLMLFDKK